MLLHRFSAFMFLAFFLSVLPGCASWRREVQEESLVDGRTVFIRQFRNGLRAAVFPEKTSPTVAVQLWYQVGSRDEHAGKTGLAHLFEHMMFKQTKNLAEGEFDRRLEQAGAEGSNAFTVRDFTAYVVEIPKESLNLVLELEAERMEHLVIDDASFRTETEVVQNERRQRYENSPEGTMYKELFELAFEKSSYRWPVIGYAEDLAAMTAKDGQAFYQTFYHPSRAIIVLVGDTDPGEAFNMIEKRLGSIGTDRPIEPRLKPPSEPVQKSPKRKTLRFEMPNQLLLMGLRSPPATAAGFPALQAAARVLAGGRSSRLHRALVDSGIASSVSFELAMESGDSLSMLVVTLQQGRQAAEAEKVILSEISRLSRHPPAAEELAAARNQLRFAAYSELTRHESLAESVGSALSLYGSLKPLDEHLKALKSLHPEEVSSAIKTYWPSKYVTTVVGVPK